MIHSPIKLSKVVVLTKERGALATHDPLSRLLACPAVGVRKYDEPAISHCEKWFYALWYETLNYPAHNSSWEFQFKLCHLVAPDHKQCPMFRPWIKQSGDRSTWTSLATAAAQPLNKRPGDSEDIDRSQPHEAIERILVRLYMIGASEIDPIVCDRRWSPLLLDPGYSVIFLW